MAAPTPATPVPAYHGFSTPEGRARSQRARIAALVIGTLYLCLLVPAWITVARVGYTGIASELPGAEGAVITDLVSDGPAHRAGLRLGDEILTRNGVPETDRMESLRVLLTSRPGDPHTLTFRRAAPDGTAIAGAPIESVTFPLGTLLSEPDILIAVSVTSLVGLLFLFIALLVGLARPRDPAARPLLVAAIAFALLLAMPSLIYLPVELYFVQSQYISVLFNLVCAALLHLFLVFPTPNPWFARLERLGPVLWPRVRVATLLLYLIPLATGLFVVFVGDAAILNALVAVGYLLATLAALVYSSRRPSTLLARKQVKWIVWAFAVAVGGTIVANVAGRLAFELLWIARLVPILLWGLLPCAIGLAVLRYRLFDIDAVVRASVTYVALAALLVLSYLAWTFALSRIGATLLVPEGEASPAIAAFAALTVALLANPVRHRLQRALDHLVYRERLAREAYAHEALDVLGRAQPQEIVAAQLTTRCVAQLALAGAWLVRPDHVDGMQPDDPHPPPGFETLPATLPDFARSVLLVAGDDVGASGVQTLPATAPALAAWYAVGARVLVPLRSGGIEALAADATEGAEGYIGVWLLGARRSGAPFDREDMAVVQRVGEQAAVLLDYERVAAQLRVAYAGLEEKVEERTHDLGEAVQALEEKSVQLEVANQHKTEFLANMSHELRTPLNAIIGFAEVLLERPPRPQHEREVQYLGNIRVAGRHLLALINEILDLSKVEAGRMDLEVRRFSLPETIEASLLWIHEPARRKHIEVTLDVDPHLGMIEADERKVKQVVVNLLSNAVKFTPDGGRIEVTARRSDDTAQVAVRDTGVGIPPEDQDRIFAAFEQTSTGALPGGDGTGLGLAIARRLVELHGGRLWVESTVGQGSTFTFSLPLRQPVPTVADGPVPVEGADRPPVPLDEWTIAAAAPEPAVDGHDGSPRVLAIDNHPMAIEVIEAVLAPEGYQVLAALSGTEGLARARQERPSLIILDLMMPDLDGFAVLDRLHADPTTAAIPVVVLTSKTLSQQERAVLADQVCSIGRKGDFDRAAFVELVRSHAHVPA